MTQPNRLHRFIDIQPVVVEDLPDAHNVFLQVTNQRFCVTPYACQNREEAEWMRDQFCVALERIIADVDGEEQSR